MESYEILWEMTSAELEKTAPSVSYNTFIPQLTPVDIMDNKLVLCTKSSLTAESVEKRFKFLIKDALAVVNNEILDFNIVIAASREEYLSQLGDAAREKAQTQGAPINPKLTFDSFVVGKSNEFIYAAAKAVAETPSDAYNPLFIWGDTGLGKTHILMAIANYINAHFPSTNVVYTTCEQFTNQFIEGISKAGKGSISDFKKTYRSVDVLLIDDIQFLSKKPGTQTEFFNTFEDLILHNKQIVLASDRPPREIEVLEDRLRTRFEGGLVADVQPPELETRVAILKRKAEERKCIVDIGVLTHLAEMNEGVDIRTLIGKLTKVVFASKLHEVPITVELVKDALQESVGEAQEALQADDIIRCVSNYFKVSKAEILGKSKKREVVEPRQICIYLIYNMMSLPLDAIGQKMGGRDHATVIYSRDKIAEQIKTDSKLGVAINDIKNMLLKQ